MTTLQEYLNQKYPTREERAEVKEIGSYKISKERENQGITELLEKGELDLSEYVGLEKIKLYSRISPTKLILGNNPKLNPSWIVW